MPKKKKAIELTDEEALKRLFPKQVRDELKRIAHEKDPKPKSASKKRRSQD